MLTFRFCCTQLQLTMSTFAVVSLRYGLGFVLFEMVIFVHFSFNFEIDFLLAYFCYFLVDFPQCSVPALHTWLWSVELILYIYTTPGFCYSMSYCLSSLNCDSLSSLNSLRFSQKVFGNKHHSHVFPFTSHKPFLRKGKGGGVDGMNTCRSSPFQQTMS